MAKEGATRQAVKSSTEQLLDINRRQNETISVQVRTVEEFRGTIIELNASLAQLKRKVFGKMSEKCRPVDNGDPGLPFGYDDLERIETGIEEARSRAVEQITVPGPWAANKIPCRNRVVMDNFPVVTAIIEPENADLSRYIKIGEEHIRTPKTKSGYLYVKDTARPIYTLKDEMEATDNGKKTVITAPMSLMPIYKGVPGASMLAETLLQKYEYYVPLHRQAKQLEHLGAKLSRNTLDGWFRLVCGLLRPFYLELRKKVPAVDCLQADETILLVINHERHKVAEEYIWVVRAAMPRLLFFHYGSGSRSQGVAVRFLKNFKGYLQNDGHPIYDAFEDKEGVCLCGCLAHIRRHIELCKEENPEYAIQGLKLIQGIYNVEYMADRQELPYEKRTELRQCSSEPIFGSFELWLKNVYLKVLERSSVGKAVVYAYSLLPRMKPYLHDGRIFIDSNRCESALGSLIIPRKNMLFCENHEAAENTAIICSLLDSRRERGVNPREWLNDVISRLPYYLAPKSDRDLKELLPDVWRR